MNDHVLLTEEQEGISILTLNRPEVMNAFNFELLRALNAEINTLRFKTDIRVIIVTGAGGKAFSAGADLKERRTLPDIQVKEYIYTIRNLFTSIEQLNKPVIAAVNGIALGGGTELALACDFRIAVKSAKIGLPETSIGVIPGWNGIPRLTALVGLSRAKKMYLSAQPVSAEEGLEFGLVDEIVSSPEELGPRVAEFCKSFKRASPAAVALAKRARRTGDDLSAFADCFKTDDQREGMAAFVEKRPASWME